MSSKSRIRLDRLLANMGIGTRTEVKKIIKQGRVMVDGNIIKSPNTIIDPQNQKIFLDSVQIEYSKFFYFVLNKPKGVISATYDNMHRTVIDILEDEDKNKEVFPVGRLDIDTEGLLVLTNDGQLAHKLLSPKKNVPKTYFAKVLGEMTNEDVKHFKNGITLEDGYECKSANLKIIKSDKESEVEITITEGKFHQVKRMVEAVNKKVTYLKRISMGGFDLPDDLEVGQYREMTKEEIEILLKYA